MVLAVLKVWLTGFDLAWFSSLSSECLSIFNLHGAMYIWIIFFVTFCTLPFSELSLVGLDVDLFD